MPWFPGPFETRGPGDEVGEIGNSHKNLIVKRQTKTELSKEKNWKRKFRISLIFVLFTCEESKQ